MFVGACVRVCVYASMRLCSVHLCACVCMRGLRGGLYSATDPIQTRSLHVITGSKISMLWVCVYVHATVIKDDLLF
jgi:hypothetical protein